MDVQMRNTAKFTTVKMEKTVYGVNLSPDDSLFIDRILAISVSKNRLVAIIRCKKSFLNLSYSHKWIENATYGKKSILNHAALSNRTYCL